VKNQAIFNRTLPKRQFDTPTDFKIKKCGEKLSYFQPHFTRLKSQADCTDRF